MKPSAEVSQNFQDSWPWIALLGMIGLLHWPYSLMQRHARQTRQELENNEQFTRRILESVPVGIVHVALDGSIRQANQGALGILGLSFDTLTERYIPDFEPETLWEDGSPCPPQDYPVSICLRENRQAGPATIGVRRPQGDVSWSVFTAFPLQDPASGNQIGAVATFYDITERKQWEEAITQAKEFSELLIDSSMDGILAFDTDCRYTVWNQGMEEISGIPAHQVLGRCAFDVFPFLKEIGQDAYYYDTLSGRHVVTKDRPYHTSAGKEGFFEGHYSPLQDADGQIIGGLGIIREITARKRTEQALSESEDRYRRLVEVSPEPILVHCQGLIVYANPTCLQLFGAQGETELVGKPVLDLVHPHFRDIVRQRLQRLQSEPGSVAPMLEEKLLRLDGSVVEAEVTAVPITYMGQQAILLMARDVTERKKAEKERRKLETKMQQAQKLESLGILAGGIAHDFNNILQGILGHASLLLEKIPLKESPYGHNLQQIELAALRAAELTNQMLAYSGKGQFIMQAINLADMAREMVQLVQASISKKVRICFDFAPETASIRGDASQIRQVVMNLLTNAAEAIAEADGMITIRTGLQPLAPDFFAGTILEEPLTAGLYAFIEVSDNGCGMDPATQARIFDPFFTTKFTGRGLGLASLLGIVRGHQGAIRLTSTPDLGSTFQIYFPYVPWSQEQDPEAPDSPEDSPASYSKGTVLVIDDEESIRLVARLSLEENGYHVLTASDGLMGLELFREYQAAIGVVILDMTMPKISGKETFHQMRQIRPDIRIILSSGYTEQFAISQFSEDGVEYFLQKPYKPQVMVKKVQEIFQKFQTNKRQDDKSAASG